VKSEKPTDSEVEPGNTVAELTENNNISADAQAAAKRPDIEKVSEIKEADGVHMAYAEVNGKKQDTINVIVPLDKSLSKLKTIFHPLKQILMIVVWLLQQNLTNLNPAEQLKKTV
jgi:hypothetical protein